MTLDLEKAAGDPVIGIDEAGRGPLAGPVFAAAVHLPVPAAERLVAAEWAAVNDSKKLTARKREALAAMIKATSGCIWAVASASAAEIDSLNILRATHLAMKRAHDAVAQKLGGRTANVLVDGLPVATLPHATNVIKGDAKSLLIAAASILAKTARDAYCAEMEAKYPGYGFAKHKGYPTQAHVDALRALGPCPEHRMSFAPVAQATAR